MLHIMSSAVCSSITGSPLTAAIKRPPRSERLTTKIPAPPHTRNPPRPNLPHPRHRHFNPPIDIRNQHNSRRCLYKTNTPPPFPPLLPPSQTAPQPLPAEPKDRCDPREAAPTGGPPGHGRRRALASGAERGVPCCFLYRPQPALVVPGLCEEGLVVLGGQGGGGVAAGEGHVECGGSMGWGFKLLRDDCVCVGSTTADEAARGGEDGRWLDGQSVSRG